MLPDVARGATATDPDRVVAHLISDLAGDARRAWDNRENGRVANPNAVHEHLHSALGAIGRSLLRSRMGIPLHAGACALQDARGVLLPGRTGTGKSSLVGLLAVHASAAVVSDDLVWLHDGHATGIGAPVALRPSGPLWAEARGLWYSDDSARLLVRPADLGAPATRHVAPLHAVLFPYYGHSPANTSELRPAEAFCRLVRSLMRSPSDEELDEVARFVAQTPSADLRYSDSDTALRMCFELLDSMEQPTHVVPERLDGLELERAGVLRGVAAIRFGDDVVLLRAHPAQTVCVLNWPGAALRSTPVWPELASIGLVA